MAWRVALVCTGLMGSVAVLAQSTSDAAQTPQAPEWAQPGSATHQQVAPPADFHRPTTTFNTPIGIFDGQSDVGSALAPGSASYDAATGAYTIHSAGYNVWYTRDEFRYLWKKMSGDVSLAADIAFPDPKGYGDRKAVLVIRQSLDDDAKEVVVALHGAGMIQLAQRPEQDVRVKDMEFRIGGRGRPGGASPDSLVTVMAQRIGVEKTRRPVFAVGESGGRADACSSGRRSNCIWIRRSMWGSDSARTCRRRWTRLCCRG